MENSAERLDKSSVWAVIDKAFIVLIPDEKSYTERLTVNLEQLSDSPDSHRSMLFPQVRKFSPVFSRGSDSTSSESCQSVT